MIDKIDQTEFEGFEYVNPLLMSLEDCVWQEQQTDYDEQQIVLYKLEQQQQQQQQFQQQQQQQQQFRQHCDMYDVNNVYELQERLASFHFEPFPVVNLDIYSENEHDNLFEMRNSHENDSNYNEYRLPPPFPFQYESPVYSRSISIADDVFDSGNNNNNNSVVTRGYDENDYDDVDDDENPKKGILKQMFCLPLN